MLERDIFEQRVRRNGNVANSNGVDVIQEVSGWRLEYQIWRPVRIVAMRSNIIFDCFWACWFW